ITQVSTVLKIRRHLNIIVKSLANPFHLLLLWLRVIMLSAGNTIFFGFSAILDKDDFLRWNVLHIGTERSGILMK
ncbi:MAG: hypothetical protein IIY02_03115, partial [Firmicutes bacterium]|nr:hypothetical protein [Bacillota bacterium]